VTRGPPPTTPLGGWSPQVPATARAANKRPRAAPGCSHQIAQPNQKTTAMPKQAQSHQGAPGVGKKYEKAQADVLLHRLYYALPGWDAAAERRDAQDEFHSAAQARAWADGDFGADRRVVPRLCFRRRGSPGPLGPGARPNRGGGGGCARALAVLLPPIFFYERLVRREWRASEPLRFQSNQPSVGFPPIR
jgi:hypothetical protein